MSTTKRLTALDGLRGIAALAVVVYHMTTAFDDEGYFPGYPHALFNVPGGRYGVHLFFVVSGFVILWTLSRSERLRDFGVGRFARLYPPFWGALLITSVILFFANSNARELQFTLGDFLVNLTMVPGWFGVHRIDAVYWTLAIEMSFYLGMSLLFVLKLTRRDRIVWTLVAVLGVAAFIQVASRAANGQYFEDFTYIFVAGMAAYLLWEGSARPRPVLWALYFQMPFFDLLRGRVVVAGVTGAIVVVFHLGLYGKLPFLDWKVTQFFGRISYSLYLLHANQGFLVQKWLLDRHVNRNVAILVAVAVTTLLSWAAYEIFERRVSKWLRRTMSGERRRGSVAAVA